MKNPSYLAVHIADISPGPAPRNPRASTWPWAWIILLGFVGLGLWRVM